VTHAWLVEGLLPDVRARIDELIAGPKPEDPAKAARENAQTFGKLFAMRG
jgi:hypothetical protein